MTDQTPSDLGDSGTWELLNTIWLI